MPLTKARTTYKPVKIRSYAHWTIRDWSEIERLAAERNIPPHWVVLAAGKFATSEGTKLEFMNRLDVLVEQIRSESGNPVLQSVRKGTENSKLQSLTCQFCGQKEKSLSLLRLHEKRYCKQLPLEAIIAR